MKWMLLIPLFAFAHAFADLPQFGYLRVRVTDQRDDHNFTANLLANGQRIGSPFCHSNRLDCEGRSAPRPARIPYPWAQLESVHLNFKGNSTPVTVVYNFGSSCTFDYEVDYSLDQQQIITFKPFRAPHSTGLGSIPIGTGCNSRVMKVCSSDPTYQKQLEAQFRAAVINNYNRWKADYDNRLTARIRQSEERAKLAALELERQKVNFDKGQKILESAIEKWKLELESQRERAASQDEKLNNKESEDDLEKAIANRADEAAMAERIIANEPPGGYRSFLLNRILENAQINQTLRDSGEFGAREKREFEMAQRHTEFFINDYVKGEAVWKVLDNMISVASLGAPKKMAVSYLAKTAKLCKGVVGRQLCFGAEVSIEERIKAICELSKSLPPLSGAFEKLFEDQDPITANYLKSKIVSGACARIAKELHAH